MANRGRIYRKRLYLLAFAVLFAGLGCAGLAYRQAAKSQGNRAGVYVPSPDNSKQYLRELELYGGGANVLAYRLRTWFGGLWHGKSLAYMLISITFLIVLMIFYFARHLPLAMGPECGGEERGSVGREPKR